VPPGPGVPLSNPRGDHDLQPEGFSVAPATPHRPAAVLVPVIDRPEGPTLLFTKRAAHLRDHSGQVAFPGGKVDPEDTTPIDTALREAWEEIGLESDAVRPLGYLDPYLSGTGFLVMPVVGLVACCGRTRRRWRPCSRCRSPSSWTRRGISSVRRNGRAGRAISTPSRLPST
jgi:hypothetical protein